MNYSKTKKSKFSHFLHGVKFLFQSFQPAEPYQQQYGWNSGIFPQHSGILVRGESPNPSQNRSASMPIELGAQSRDYYSRQGSPPISPPRPRKSFSPNEKTEVCEYCFREFPKGTVFFDHMMNCDKRHQKR